MNAVQATAEAAIRPLSAEELDLISGGGIVIEADKDYFGIEISIGKWGVGLWFTGGSVCGEVRTPKGQHSGCTP